jgi:hypothetical protein
MRPARSARPKAARPADSPKAETTSGSDPKRRKKKRRRRRSPLPFVMVMLVLLPILHGGYWFYTARTLKQSLEGWAAAQRAQGLTVTHAEPEMTGFPLAVTATVRDISARASPERGGWTWSTALVRVTLSPWRPTEPRLVLHEAPHALTVIKNGIPISLTARAAEAVIDMTLDFSGGLPRAVRATVRDAVAESPAWPEGPVTLATLRLDYERPGLFAAASDAAAHTLSADLTGLRLPPALHGPFAAEVSAARLDAALLGPLKPGQPLEEALRAWRDEDGRLRIDRLSVNWPPLALDSSGTLRLDTALQPEGALTTRVSGFMPVIDGLARQGLLRGRDATMAKVLLGTMARPGPDGTPMLSVPVVVRDGAVWAGPVAVLPLPRLPWGPPAGSLGASGLRPGFEIDREGRIVPNP